MELKMSCPWSVRKNWTRVRTAFARPAQAVSVSASSGKYTDQPSAEFQVLPVAGVAVDPTGCASPRLEGRITRAPLGAERSSKTSSSLSCELVGSRSVIGEGRRERGAEGT